MPNKIDRLFAAEALIKKLMDLRDELKSECASELLQAYEENGDTQRRSQYFGKGAGTFSVAFSKPKPSEEKAEYHLADWEAFGGWLDDNPMAMARYLLVHAEEFGQWWLEQTGELPDGISRIAYMTEEEPERAIGVRLAVKKDVVIDALRPQLPASVVGLLEGGGDEADIPEAD